MRSFNKVFVVALPRCATVSMCDALGELSIATAHLGKIFGEDTPGHNNPQRLMRMHEQIKHQDFKLDLLEQCQGLADYPACCVEVIEMLDREYPGSVFLNVQRRDKQRWLQSVERQFLGLQLLKSRKQATPEEQRFMEVMLDFREMTFGSRAFDASRYAMAYDEHQTWLQQRFIDRQHDYLEFADLQNLHSEGYERLCDFFDCPVVNQPFPRCNLHSELPSRYFMQALEAGTITSQTGIEPAAIE